MIDRLLTILAVTLPLAACAAGPAAPDTSTAGQPARTIDAAAAQGAPAAAPAAAASSNGQAAPAAAGSAAPSSQAAQAGERPARAPASPRAASAGTASAAAVSGGAAANGAIGGTSTPSTTPATSQTTPQTPSEPAAQAPAAPNSATTPAAAPGATVPDTAMPGRPPAAAGTPAMPGGSPTGSLLQTLFALVLVLALLAGLAWFLKRYGPRASGGTANLRVVGSLNLGGRERLLVVEVGNQWIVVGASPGRVNALATMPKQEGADAGGANAALAPHAPAANSFADWLKQTIDKRK